MAQVKGKESCIKKVRKAFDQQADKFDGLAIINAVNNMEKGVWFYDSYILRELRKLKSEEGRNFICLSKADSKYRKVADNYGE